MASDMSDIDVVQRLKKQMRTEAAARRAKQADAEHASRTIFGQLAALPEYARARTIMFYLAFHTEVRTRWFLPTTWGEGKRVAVPYCNGHEIELFRLDSLDELTPGVMHILEPKPELRDQPGRRVLPAEIDLIVTPGLAFDCRGGRLGYGKGYYDRFFHRVRGDATKAAVCFECQMFPEIPLLPHDVRMDIVVTEKAVYCVPG